MRTISDQGDAVATAVYRPTIEILGLREVAWDAGPHKPSTLLRDYRRIVLLLALLFAALTFVLRALHLDHSYDVFLDEMYYLVVSDNVADSHRLAVDGVPIYLHPPAYFFIEAGFLKLFHPTGDIVHRVYAVRYLNVGFASISVAALFLIARRAAGLLAGIIAALLFALDPFVNRWNSQAMLETSAVCWVVLGFAIIMPAATTNRRRMLLWRAVAGGSAFGLALLTKEMTFFLTLAPLVALLLFNWSFARRDIGLIGAVAAAWYAAYMLVVVAVGDWVYFADQKLSGVKRFLGILKPTGFQRGGGSLLRSLLDSLPFFGHHSTTATDKPSFVQAVSSNLSQLGTTYALLALGFVAMCMLFFLGGAARRVIAVWAACSYTMIAYSIIIGTLEEQFFYFIIVPAILTTAIAAAVIVRRARAGAPLIAIMLRNNRIQATLARALRCRDIWRAGVVAPRVLIVVGILFMVWSIAIWGRIHSTRDNGYERALTYFTSNVPLDRHVAATTETAQFMLRQYAAGSWGTVPELRTHGVNYVIVNTQEVYTGYGTARPDFYLWLQQNGEVVYEFAGRRDIVIVYRLPDRY